MTDTKKITAAEHHLLVAFAHCENTPLNGAPMQAQQPSDLSTWVWLDDRKVGDMTTAQKKGGRERKAKLLGNHEDRCHLKVIRVPEFELNLINDDALPFQGDLAGRYRPHTSGHAPAADPIPQRRSQSDDHERDLPSSP